MRLQVGFGMPITEDLEMTGEMKKKQKNENLSTEVKRIKNLIIATL
jgi:hypothetical protein